MPEGHTIHRLARDLRRTFGGAAVQARSPQGRFDAGAERLDGAVCESFDAFGKHLFGHFATGDVLHVHLGLIGRFRRQKGDPQGAVRLRLTADDVHWDLRGPMVCDLGPPTLVDEITASLGPDPLRDRDAFEEFRSRLLRRRIAIGAALLDQKVIAGIGNVYRSELCFLAGINPQRPANTLDDDEVAALWRLSVDLLSLGVRLNRIVTVDPHLAGFASARAIPKGERLHVYKRDGAPCLICDTPIEQAEIGQRTMWECPTCQE